MTEQAAFSATYSDFRLIKGRKVVQLVFEVPIEQANMALAALGGMPNPAAEVWCGIAVLDLEAIKKEVMQTDHTRTITETSPALAPEQSVRAHKPVAPEKRLAQRAGILCNDPSFRKFLSVHGPWGTVTGEFDVIMAAEALRDHCAVTTRSEIIPGTPAGDRFEQLLNKYAGWQAGLLE